MTSFTTLEHVAMLIALTIDLVGVSNNVLISYVLNEKFKCLYPKRNVLSAKHFFRIKCVDCTHLPRKALI